MTIKITVPEDTDAPELKPRICVIGVGGAGGNAVNNMIAANLEGCDFIVANTDAQALKGSKADRRIQLGTGVTRGLGAGSKPDVGRAAAEESIEDILGELSNSHMVFIAAGMGGGTGTGAAPVIARAAREAGILTVGVVTKPFQFEGSHRMRLAEKGLEELSGYVDTLIIIPNQNLFRVANEKTTFADAFKMADDVLYSGVRSITDLMVMPGLINLDFADVQSVMQGMGRAMMGTGEASGERRALDAAEAAISNPLLDDASMRGARGVLINITGGEDITLFEVDEAANRVRAEVDEDAYIIIGSAFDQSMQGTMRVSVVATGLEAAEGQQPSHLNMLQAARRIEPVRVPRPEEAAPTAAAKPAVFEPMAAAMGEPAAEFVEEAAEVEPLALADVEPAFVAESASEAPAIEELPAAFQAPAQPEPRTPAAMPAAGNVETFIPPKPVEVAEEPAPLPMPARAADPFKMADMVNGGPAEAPAEPARGGLLKRVVAKKDGGGLSLFERVTGTGRAKKVEETAEIRQETGGHLAPQSGSRGTIDALVRARSAETPARETAAARPERPAIQPAEGHKLGGVGPADRMPASSDDDLLDIPAFLRRQAN